MRRRQGPATGQASDPAHKPWLPRRDTTVLLLSRSPQLQGEVGRVAAAAAVELVIGEALEQNFGAHGDIAAVLVDAAPDAATPGWRGPVIVVGFTADADRIWQQAAKLEADRVAFLPDSAHWLADYLACLQNPASRAGVLGVVGGCGGSGASTLSLLVAAEAASRGTRTLLVDGDRWGGGLGVMLSAQEAPGLRWPELLQVSGSINPGQLAAALPQVGPLALLSWEQGRVNEGEAGTTGTSPDSDYMHAPTGLPAVRGRRTAVPLHAPSQTHDAVDEVMRAAQGAYELVVVDLGRTPEALSTFGIQCNGMMVVVPGRARAVAAALQLRAELPAVPSAAVVRGPMAEGIDAEMVATAAGLPLAGELPWLRGVDQALLAQRLPELLHRRRVRGLLAGVLDWMAGESATAQSARAAVSSGAHPGVRP
ncbi:septum site-determining protein Ssd [Arthrobacter sp. BF1]|uniref:septum site-determining protein Ssd n=1 Tax=Arthrobacter sp. BF1 TaxID=2821145 RepID=UPI001C4FED18|nr:septum site-determining protein Ssd [Arthrobacter sp. BF1]